MTDGEPPGATEVAAHPRRQWRGALRLAVLAVGLLTAPVWGRPLLRRLDFFRVRRVEILGVRYVSADQIVSRLGIDSMASLWDDVEPLEQRVRRHPSVREVRIERRLPGTLLVRITENPPVALVQGAGGLVPTDAMGRTLPVDPAITDVDLPVLAARDTAALRVLGEARERSPALFARIGEIRRSAGGDLVFRLTEFPARQVLAGANVTADRLAEILPVGQDLLRRKLHDMEIDLRYRDQIVARPTGGK